MIELDGRLRILQQQGREWAAVMRPLALEIDGEPDAVFRHLDLPVLHLMATFHIPPEYRPCPLVIGGHRFYGMTALERVVLTEELAYGDAGLLLAAPGAPIPGIVVHMLGDENQQEWFYSRMLERVSWAFFALTEPAHGSDAGSMETTLTPAPDREALLLRGAKRYVGNAARARLGVVCARTQAGPLGPAAVLVEASAPGFEAEPIETFGLRGAQISAISLNDVEIPPDRVLGRHLSPTRRGMWSLTRALNVLRPSVASIAVGISRAAHEYAVINCPPLRPAHRELLDDLSRQIDHVRRLVHHAASAVDADAANGHLASAAKARAVRLAETATCQALLPFGSGARLDHPLLDKLARDALGLEFMEGTSNIQKLNLFQRLGLGRTGHG